MRFIYVDEAGISEHELVTVVAGVLVHADSQWIPAARRVAELHQTVPEKFRSGFVSHAKRIWGSKEYRDGWPQDARLKFLCDMMAIPWNYGLTLAWATMPRSYVSGPIPPGYSKEQYQHAVAFGTCMGAADKYIREFGLPGELATVVAEDTESARGHLRTSLQIVRARPDAITGKLVRVSDSPLLRFRRGADDGIDIRVCRIVDNIHFSAKNEAILLQIADACAFGLRRYHSKQSTGIEFLRAIYGEIPNVPTAEDSLPCMGLISGKSNPQVSFRPPS